MKIDFTLSIFHISSFLPFVLWTHRSYSPLLYVPFFHQSSQQKTKKKGKLN